MVLEWKEPPNPRNKLGRVMEELVAHPNAWAMVDVIEGFFLNPWWRPLIDNPRFEYRIVAMDDFIFGKREVYVKYTGDPDATGL